MNKFVVFIIVIVLISAASISGLFLPKLPPIENTAAPAPGECVLGDKPTDLTNKWLPEIDGMNDRNSGGGGRGAVPNFCTGAPYSTDTVGCKQFVPIRKKLQLKEKLGDAENASKSLFGGAPEHSVLFKTITVPADSTHPQFKIYYPGRYGEVTIKNSYVDHFNDPIDQTTVEVRFRQHGIIFFVYANPDGTILNTASNGDRYYIADLYMDKDRYDSPYEKDLRDKLLWECTGASTTTGVTQPVMISEIPTGSPGNEKQLQLKTVIFKQNQQSGRYSNFDTHCKPAIYLYPQQKTEVNVKVNTKGELLYTDPLYPQDTGWTTVAYPDGKLVYKGKTYPYLYYESRIPDGLINKPTQGFVVEYEKLPGLYDEILPKLGLDTGQTKDFKEYWIKTLPKSKYYFVGILDEANINNFEPLSITPNYDTMVRVRLYFEGLDKKISVQEPAIQTPVKKGFTVVEWGAMVKTDKNHPFTCSQ